MSMLHIASCQEIACDNQQPQEFFPPIVTTDAKGTITEANDSFIKAFCFKRSELIGQELSCIFHEDTPSELLESARKALLRGASWRGVIKYRRKHDERYWYDVYCIPLMNNDQLSGVRAVLFQPTDLVKQRAETIYQDWSKYNARVVLANKKPGLSQQLLALIGVPTGGLALLGVLYVSWPYTLIALALTMLSMGLGWRLLKDFRELCHCIRKTNSDPLSCYLYTGGTNDTCIIRHALDTRRLKLQALAACVSQTRDALRYAKARSDQFMAQVNVATRNQNSLTQAIHQAMRSILEDQYHTTVAATQTQQRAFDSHTNNLQGREKLKRLLQSCRHQLQALEQGLQHLPDPDEQLVNPNEQLGHAADIIKRISAAVDEIQITCQNTKIADNQTDPASLIKKVQQLAGSTRDSVNQLQPMINRLTNSAQTALTAIETGIQASVQIIAMAQDTDHVLQTIISEVNRINSLALEVSNAMHHQSITRATANYRLEALQENAVNAIQANRQVGYQAEKLTQQIDELHYLVNYFSKAV